MKNSLVLFLIYLLSSCASNKPAPVEYQKGAVVRTNKNFKVKIIKTNINHFEEEDDDDTKDSNYGLGWKQTAANNQENVEEPHQEVNKQDVTEQPTIKTATENKSNKSSDQILKEKIEQELSKFHSDEEDLHENIESARKFSILPVNGRVIKKFTQIPGKNFEAIIFNAQKGSLIKSVSEGKVIYSGFDPKFGNIVIVLYKDFQVAYGYIKEVIVKKGSILRVGDIIGYVGDIVNSKDSGLYFAIRSNNKPIDPETMLP